MKDKKHIDHIRTLDCIACQGPGGDAHHVRNSYNAGMGMKPDGKYCLPLCREHHTQLHVVGEDLFWEAHNINPYEQICKIIIGG